VKRICTQLSALPTGPRPTIEELKRTGKWIELADLFLAIDQFSATVSLDGERTFSLASRVQDALLLHICVRDFAVKRPGCMAAVTVPTPTGVLHCSEPDCIVRGCRGNSLERIDGEQYLMHLSHFKTSRTHKPIALQITTESRVGELLHAHLHWGRALLLRSSDDHCRLWISPSGAAHSPASVGRWLPKVLKRIIPGSHLTTNTVRHAVASAALRENLDETELAGVAAAMQTSVRKLKEVYQDDRQAFLTNTGNEVYRRLGGASAVATATATAPQRDADAAAAPVQLSGLAAFRTRSDDEPPELAEDREVVDGGEDTNTAQPVDINQFLGGGALVRRRGRPTKHTATGHVAFLTAQQVDDLSRAGGERALKRAFTAIYGSETTKGGEWLKRKLQRE